MSIEPFDYNATQTLNGFYILDIVVEDSLKEGHCMLSWRDGSRVARGGTLGRASSQIRRGPVGTRGRHMAWSNLWLPEPGMHMALPASSSLEHLHALARSIEPDKDVQRLQGHLSDGFRSSKRSCTRPYTETTGHLLSCSRAFAAKQASSPWIRNDDAYALHACRCSHLVQATVASLLWIFFK